MNFHETVNLAEAGLWAGIGVVFVVVAFRERNRGQRARYGLTAVAFLAFGGSDVVEIQTGAWRRPWWLLLRKAVCVILLFGLLLSHWNRNKKH